MVKGDSVIRVCNRIVTSLQFLCNIDFRFLHHKIKGLWMFF